MAPAPLDSADIPVRTIDTPPPQPLLAHHRSLSDGQARNVLPKAPRATTPTELAQQPTTLRVSDELKPQGSSGELKESGSGIVRPLVAPSPMKEWASGWSPSLLEAAGSHDEKQRFPQPIGRSPDKASPAKIPPSSTPPPTAAEPIPCAQPPKPQQMLQHTPPPPTVVYLAPSITAQGQPTATYVYNPYSFTAAAAPPQFQVLSQPISATYGRVKKNPPKDPNDTGKSDASAFVFNGWLYPAGLNRKERRRICFQPEVVPTEVAGSLFVGSDVPDGPRSPRSAAELMEAKSTAPRKAPSPVPQPPQPQPQAQPVPQPQQPQPTAGRWAGAVQPEPPEPRRGK